MTERIEELVRYGPDGAPQALAEAWEIAESIGGATPSGRDTGNRTIALLMVWCGLAAAVCGRWGPGSILTALTCQRMAGAFAATDPARALGYAHAVATTPETALVKVDTLVDIATAVLAPQLRGTPRVPRPRQA